MPEPTVVTWADAVAAVRSMVDTAAELGRVLEHVERLAVALPAVTVQFDPTPDDVWEDAAVACEHMDSLIQDVRWLHAELARSTGLGVVE